MLKIWSCAIGLCEPCQVGNQAALSSLPCVPQGCRFGAGCPGNGCSIHPAEKTPGSFGPGVFIFFTAYQRERLGLSTRRKQHLFFENIGEFAAFKRPAEHRPIQSRSSQLPIGGPCPRPQAVFKTLTGCTIQPTLLPPDVCPWLFCAFLTKHTDVFSCAQIFCRKSRFRVKTWLTRRGTSS